MKKKDVYKNFFKTAYIYLITLLVVTILDTLISYICEILSNTNKFPNIPKEISVIPVFIPILIYLITTLIFFIILVIKGVKNIKSSIILLKQNNIEKLAEIVKYYKIKLIPLFILNFGIAIYLSIYFIFFNVLFMGLPLFPIILNTFLILVFSSTYTIALSISLMKNKKVSKFISVLAIILQFTYFLDIVSGLYLVSKSKNT